MKKLFALMLTLALALSMTACKPAEDDPSDSTGTEAVSTDPSESTSVVDDYDPTSSGDIVVLPATDGDMETEEPLPASDGSLNP